MPCRLCNVNRCPHVRIHPHTRILRQMSTNAHMHRHTHTDRCPHTHIHTDRHPSVSQGRRRLTKCGPVVDNDGRVGGAAPGRVREGGHPFRPARGYGGSAVSSPSGVWGGAPEANAFCVIKPSKNYTKSARIYKYSTGTCTYRTEFVVHSFTTLRHRASAFHIFNLAGPACLSSMKQMHAT